MMMNRFLLLVIFCTSSLSCHSQEFDNECLQNIIDSAIPKDSKDSVTLDLSKSMKCVEWDSVLISAPHYSSKWVLEKTNLKVPKFPFFDDDSYCYLFFVKDNLVVQSFKVSRGQVDLTSIISDRKNGYNFYDRSTQLVIYASDSKFTNGKNIVNAKVLE